MSYVSTTRKSHAAPRYTVGPLYNYESQRWEQIDTETDAWLGRGQFSTPTGLIYEVDGRGNYKNA